MAPERMLFVDTETTGLAGAGTVAFLVGMAWLEGDGLCVTQLFLRDYAQEAAQLEAFAARLDWAQCLVSFNGKSFDLPVLRDRFTMLRMREKWREKPHLDLLHAARRTWKARLGDCSLGALERKIFAARGRTIFPARRCRNAFLVTCARAIFRLRSLYCATTNRMLCRLSAVVAAHLCLRDGGGAAEHAGCVSGRPSIGTIWRDGTGTPLLPRGQRIGARRTGAQAIGAFLCAYPRVC